MSQITVTLPDGSHRQVGAGTPVSAIAAGISPRLADAALVAWVNDRLVDLDHPLTADAAVRIVTSKNPEALEVYRHSTAHLLAAAVTALFPKVQCGIGPPTDEGFFYDFVVERPFVPEDIAAIEARMRELAEAGFVYERQMWPRDEAIEFFRQRDEPLKVQLIEEKTPRTRETLRSAALEAALAGALGVRPLEPLGYRESLGLMAGARLVLTDSGGVQEETSYLGVPCLTLRPNTERPVTVSLGTNTVVGEDVGRAWPLVEDVLAGRYKTGQPIPGWDGRAAERVAAALGERYAGPSELRYARAPGGSGKPA